MTKRGNVCAAHREMDAETASAMPSTRAASGDHQQATVMKTGEQEGRSGDAISAGSSRHSC
jgi:hypothetical protein